MKLSRKVKKCLIIMASVLLPVFIIFTVYLSYYKEPVAYRRMKESLVVDDATENDKGREVINPKIQTGEKIKKQALDSPRKINISGSSYTLQYLLRDLGPLRYFSLENRVNTVSRETVSNWYTPQNGDWGYRQSGLGEIHRNLNQFLDETVLIVLKHQEMKSPIDPNQEQKYYYQHLLTLATFRAHLEGDRQLCQTLIHYYTDMIIESKEPISIYHYFEFPGYLWACYEAGMLTETDIEQLRQNISEYYNKLETIGDNDELFRERNLNLLTVGEHLSHAITTHQYEKQRPNTTFNVFMKETLDGVPLVIWDELFDPVYNYHIQEYVAALANNDLGAIRRKKEKINSIQKVIPIRNQIRELEMIAFNAVFPIYPDGILNDFPYITESNTIKNKILSSLVLLDVIRYHQKHGDYPEGEIFPENDVNYSKDHHQFYVVETKSFTKEYSLSEGDESTTRTITRTFPHRYNFIESHCSKRLENDELKYLDVNKAINDKQYHQKVKGIQPVNRICCYVSYWHEAEPILQELFEENKKEGEP